MEPKNSLLALQKLQRISDYSIGFLRYENQFTRFDKRRVVWEFEWNDEVSKSVDHPGIEGRYFTSPPFHHQGMFMATREQLVAWKTRGPNCKFDRPIRRYGYHRERTSGAMDLYDTKFLQCDPIASDGFDGGSLYTSYAKQKQRASSETSSFYNGCTQATNEVSFKHSKKEIVG